MEPRKRLSAAATLGLLLVWLPSCGGDPSPTQPSGATGTATPAPTPQPTPTPAPTPPPPVGMSCANIPSGTRSTAICGPRDSRFFSSVSRAVDAARSATWVDPATGMVMPLVQEGGRILAARGYIQAVLDDLDSQGVCGVFDGYEIQVRDGGVDNENFDVITSEGSAWVHYVTSCEPPLPIPDPPPVPTVKADPECALPPSAEYYCAPQSEQLAGFVWAAQDALIAEDRARETPLVFDFDDQQRGLDYSFRIIEPNLYVSGMIDKLHGQGLCATFDGEEFDVKRGTNTFSENHDLTKFDGYAIRLYKSTCRDASF